MLFRWNYQCQSLADSRLIQAESQHESADLDVKLYSFSVYHQYLWFRGLTVDDIRNETTSVKWVDATKCQSRSLMRRYNSARIIDLDTYD